MHYEMTWLLLPFYLGWKLVRFCSIFIEFMCIFVGRQFVLNNCIKSFELLVMELIIPLVAKLFVVTITGRLNRFHAYIMSCVSSL